jgi:hypothetical protein
MPVLPLLILAAPIVAILAFRAIERRLIYFPSVTAVPPAAQVLPGAEAIDLVTRDGVRLGAWRVASPRAPSAGTIVVFNGNAGDRSMRAPLARALAEGGWDVLLFDYRGYAGQAGTPSEVGLLADGCAAVAAVSRPSDPRHRIVYLGESLGAAVAVQLAAEAPPDALVLRSPFTSLVDMGALHYPLVPARFLLRDRWDSLARIGAIRCPILVIAGERDAIVPPAQSERLLRAARGPSRWVVIPGADHNDPEFLDGPRFLAEVRRFLEEHAAEPPAAAACDIMPWWTGPS